MIDIFMLILTIIFSIVLLAVSLYIVIQFSHPDDNGCGNGLLSKIVAVLGLALAWGQVFFLPLDVANARGTGGGFRMDIAWQLLYIVYAIMLFGIVPLAISIYEVDPDDSKCKKLFGTIGKFFITIIIAALVFVITFACFGEAYVPIVSVACDLVATPSNAELKFDNYNDKCQSNDSTLKITVSFPIFCIGLLSFISYFLFTFFCGIGLFALPLDLIYNYCTRPKRIAGPRLEAMKKEVVQTAIDLKDLAMQVKKLEDRGAHKKGYFSQERREHRGLFKQLSAGVNILEQQFEVIDFQRMLSGRSIICYYFSFFGGVILTIISLIWLVHIVVYVIIAPDGKPLNGFLNIILVGLTESGVSFIAIAIFSFICFYLQLATLKGNLKFGIRFPLLGSVHPIKKNATYMNSILFNVMVIMLSSVSVNQFCVKCFGEYTAMTDIDLIFGTQIKYLMFFQYFFKYNIFEYAMCALIVISVIYLACRPSDANTVKAILYKKLEEEGKDVSGMSGKSDTMIEMRDTTNVES